MQPTDSSPDLDSRIAAAVERAVQNVREELLNRVQETEDHLRELVQSTAPTPAPPAEPAAAAAPSGVGELLQGFVALDRARSQPEVLGALLKGAGRFGRRSALFLTRPDGVQGWGSYGFEEIADRLSSTHLPHTEEGPWARLAEGRGCVVLDAADCDEVCRSLGASSPADGLLVPFVLRDRVAAALYVDRDEDDAPLAIESLQMLTHVAAHSVEGLAVRQRAETPTLHLAGAAAGPGLALWEAEEAVAEPAAVEEEPVAEIEEEAAAAAEEEPTVGIEEEAVAFAEAPAELLEAVEPELAEEAPVEAAEEAPVEVAEEAPVEVAPEVPIVEEPPTVAEELGEPEPLPEIEPVAEEAMAAETTEIPVVEETVAEAEEFEPELEAAPPLEPVPETEAPIAELEAPEPELPPIPEIVPPAPPLAEPPAAEPESMAEPLIEPPAPTLAVPEPPPPPVAEAPSPAAAVEVDRDTTEVRPPSDVEGPGWAFTTTRAPAEAGDEAQHEEARRLARLLVTEIKLYNEEQVEEGRRSNDIYARLREDIDRSRQIFDERVDPGIREETDYFEEEMVRILGGGNRDALGL